MGAKVELKAPLKRLIKYVYQMCVGIQEDDEKKTREEVIKW